MSKPRKISQDIANYVRGRSVDRREFESAFPRAAVNGTLVAVLVELGYLTERVMTPAEQRAHSLALLKARVAKMEAEQ